MLQLMISSVAWGQVSSCIQQARGAVCQGIPGRFPPLLTADSTAGTQPAASRALADR